MNYYKCEYGLTTSFRAVLESETELSQYLWYVLFDDINGKSLTCKFFYSFVDCLVVFRSNAEFA